MEEYKPNSNKAKAEMPANVAHKVTEGNVKVKKNGFLSLLIGELVPDDVPSIKIHILKNVLIPGLLKAISDSAHNSIDMFFRKNTPGLSPKIGNETIPYRNYYGTPNVPQRTGSVYDFERLIFSTYGEAAAVLEELHRILRAYEIVRVADLFEAASVEPKSTDYGYGWTDLRDARVVRTYDGYTLRLPRPLPLR